MILWLLLLGVLGWTSYRRLLGPLGARLDDARLAARLQQRFAALDDRLLSAVEFLRRPDDDPLAGSAVLRRSVIAEATAQCEPLDFGELLDRRRPQRAALAMLAAGLVAAAAVIFDPASVQIAAARLLDPFSNVAWPQATHLKLRQPVDRVARGRALEIEVVDANGARLPAERPHPLPLPGGQRPRGRIGRADAMAPRTRWSPVART